MDTEGTVVAEIADYDAYHPDSSYDFKSENPEVGDRVSTWDLQLEEDGFFSGYITLEKNGSTFVMAGVRLSPDPEAEVDFDADPDFLQRLNPDVEVPGAEQGAETSEPPPSEMAPEVDEYPYVAAYPSPDTEHPLEDEGCSCEKPQCEECNPYECSFIGRCTGYCDTEVMGVTGGCAENRVHPQVEAEQNEITAEEISARLPTDSQARKDVPLARGVLDYFPDALAEVARLSKVGNDKHNPGQDLHWARDKSKDHADCIMRHLIERGETDTDGLSHTVKVAWRALALLQEELEAAGAPMSRGSR